MTSILCFWTISNGFIPPQTAPYALEGDLAGKSRTSAPPALVRCVPKLFTHFLQVHAARQMPKYPSVKLLFPLHHFLSAPLTNETFLSKTAARTKKIYGVVVSNFFADVHFSQLLHDGASQFTSITLHALDKVSLFSGWRLKLG